MPVLNLSLFHVTVSLIYWYLSQLWKQAAMVEVSISVLCIRKSFKLMITRGRLVKKEKRVKAHFLFVLLIYLLGFSSITVSTIGFGFIASGTISWHVCSLTFDGTRRRPLSLALAQFHCHMLLFAILAFTGTCFHEFSTAFAHFYSLSFAPAWIHSRTWLFYDSDCFL
jgi:hypothetical protein